MESRHYGLSIQESTQQILAGCFPRCAPFLTISSLYCYQWDSTRAFLPSFQVSVPYWLTIPGPVNLKCHVRTSKTEPLVDEVELIGVNSHYAHVRYPDGRETTESTRHLAPCGEPTDRLTPSVPIEPDPHTVSTPDSSEMEGIPAPPSTPDPVVPLRWSERSRNQVDRLFIHFLRKGWNAVIEDWTAWI